MSKHIIRRFRWDLLRYALLMGVAILLTTTLGCRSEHKTAADFDPVWDKLLVNVASFKHHQPTGVAVSSSGRLFVNFPFWSDKPSASVVEIMPDQTMRPFPSKSWNRWNGKGGPSALRGFVCAQALYVDRNDFLWVLDSGNPRHAGVVTAGPKLFKIDLSDDSIAQVFYFDHKADLGRQAYLSDFRIDEDQQYAYITDSGRGGLFVVNLKTWDAHNVLLNNDSTKAESGVIPRIGSRQWQSAFGFVPQIHSSGVELSPDRKWLYYHALTGRTLYRVPTEVLRDPAATDEQVVKQVQDLGSTGSIVDGMWMDPQNNLYMTAIEKDAILVRRPDGKIETLVADERMQWPDSLAMGPGDYLYVTTSMRHLTKPGQTVDGRRQPYYVMKVSLPNVERAVRAKQAWEDAQAQAQQAQKTADAQRRLTAQRQAAAQAQQRQAQLQQRQADQAAQQAQAASAVEQQALASAQDAALQQAQGADQAREAAQQAQQRADEAKEAAVAAREAAVEARRRALDAQAKIQARKQAQHAAGQSQAQADALEADAQRQVEIAQHAAAKAEAAQTLAQQRDAQAQSALAQADKAVQVAQQEQLRSQDLAQQFEAAQANAAQAQAQAQAAEYAELGTPDAPPATAETSATSDSTASVPTP